MIKLMLYNEGGMLKLAAFIVTAKATVKLFNNLCNNKKYCEVFITFGV